jgi:hypothetical protein
MAAVQTLMAAQVGQVAELAVVVQIVNYQEMPLLVKGFQVAADY